MSVGTSRHYRIDEIRGRHFMQTATAAGLPKSVIAALLEEIADTALKSLQKVEAGLPKDFPASLHASVSKGVKERLDVLAAAQ
jgi:serine/threonine-protein kinase HipA